MVAARRWWIPDPGRIRLRAGLRAVLGTGLAVTAVLLAGFGLEAALLGGLAALLALFTVSDPDVRRQVATTGLLPLAGLPVLAAGCFLHDRPLERAAAFLGVVFVGVWARRFGPRGNALGIFAFMMLFAVQFLGAPPADLIRLVPAVLLALVCAALVRFVLWCWERHTPPPAAPAPPPFPGRLRPTTRQAHQAVVACAVALAVGIPLSPERWYWAVGAAWWIFVNTASRGETLVRGFRRVLGTVLGVVAGVLLALPLDGAPVPTALLAAVCVFGIFHAAPVSYSWMMFAVTVLVGLLYGLLGELSAGLLAMRLLETGVGAVAAVLAVALVLPITTHAATHGWILRALEATHGAAREAARRLAGDPGADPARRVAELEPLLDRARLSLAPLLHPLNPLRARRARAREVTALLDECAERVRALARLAETPGSAADARFIEACDRVAEAIRALPVPPPTGSARRARSRRAAGEVTAVGDRPAHHPALAQLHGLETAVRRLAGPLQTPPRTPLGTA
ncbi:FUSC family protein [Streptomyces sp. ST2-7A]|uniref:FUSC family protein n=1 Tax=Streptomyces sp. ST2-7A TaxID=2907214 RepID=UPI001F221C98|nr:FUSC family protein [Streptomyces sp. ST2-7A]MCE7079319.1 FUSC family protein [Streptomyces sp. ST2-7A]